ncbi:CDP-glycerol glycerophosphotransferase family protein [Pseudomonas juntendi]|uniref:CDP-glycerol glycerophosphotransferase family protein n=1 Tax=Pseudomonas juntendi TaxID=2666183 RepID=UPI001B82CADC|nr:CDP-glycerol glycerophosphotransferase family protein [Pseudomonas juntendi]MBR7523020.1 CDP-glycerol glycerophosphotransferase family protein [Pseudomonas juntendi]
MIEQSFNRSAPGADEQTCATPTVTDLLQCLESQVLPALPVAGHLLQIGCADPELTLLLAQHAAQVVVCEWRDEVLTKARALVSQAGIEHVRFHQADALAFTSAERFDAICLMGVLATIDDDNDVARLVLHALSMLKPDGRIILQHDPAGVKAVGDAAERSAPRCVALVRSLGLREVFCHPLQGAVLYGFAPILGKLQALPIAGLRVACYGSMPFHFRSLRPLAACFETSLLSLSIDDVMAWKPQVIVVADGWSVEFWRDYCDAHGVLLVGMRHGSVTRYGFAEPQYRCADYMCGSVWDIEDTLLSNVRPRHGFLLTGNAWVDQVFRLAPRAHAQGEPTILFAPTYNPEISAAVYFGDRVVPLIRSVYPRAKIIIKPHPAIVQHEHSFVVDKALFRNLMGTWREQAAADPLVSLVDDPEASIADSFAEADILVADRSSLLFEFMVLDRPILLYSSEKRVGHWQYNPDAPGNAWRDIGMEFADDTAFLELLSDAHHCHAENCRAAQRERVRHLYGDFQDGRSVERVAAAIATVPRLHVVVDGRLGLRPEVVEALDDRLAFKRISVLQGDDKGAAATAWLAQRWADAQQDLGFMLVDGEAAYIPGSAHQVSDGLAALASGECEALVLSEPQALPAPMASADKQQWIKQRLQAALAQRQGRQAWQLLPAHVMHRALGQLPECVDDEVFSVLWQTLGAHGVHRAWQSEQLNVVLGPSLIRVVGARQAQYLAGPQASLRLQPAVLGHARQPTGVEVLLCCAAGQQYDVFPFTTELWINGHLQCELHFSDTRAQRVLLPYRPDEQGTTTVELRSAGAFPGMPGLAGPLSLYLAFVDPQPVTGPSQAHIHQIFYSEETRAMLEPGFTPFDNTGQRPDWAEYWPIRTLLLDKQLDENAFYGVLSPRFKQKTGLNAQQVLEFCSSAPAEADVLLFPMFFDESALYENVFIQGLIYHPNIWPAFVEMARRLAPGVDIETLVMDARHSQFCNYFIAKPRFWRHWLNQAESIFQAAEQARDARSPSPYGAALNAPTYHRGTAGYESKVFVMERLLPLILATQGQWKVHAYDHLKLPVMRHPINADFIELNELKVRMRSADSPELRAAYVQMRDQILRQKALEKNPEGAGLVRPVAETIRIAMAQYPRLPVPTDVSTWLAERVPSSAQQRLIKARLEDKVAPLIGVVVIDRAGDADALAATLESFTPDRHLYADVKIVVLRPGEPQEPTAAEGKLRFMQLEDDQLPVIQRAVAEAGCNWFMLVEAGTTFTASGLLIAALDLLDTQGLRAVYGDEVVQGDGDELGLALRPDLNLDMLLSLPAVFASHWLYNSDAWLAAGGFRSDAGQAYELDYILRLIEDKGLEGLGHISEPLLVRRPPLLQNCADTQRAVGRHLQARGYTQARVDSRVPGQLDVHYGAEQALVSILLSTQGGFARARRCMESILEKTLYPAFEVLLLDHGNDEPSLQTWLAGVEGLGTQAVRVLRLPHGLSLAQARNQAALSARGEYLLWLDTGVAVLEDDWLLRLVNHAFRQEVGAVGAKLVGADFTVRQGGLILGLNGPVGQIFMGQPLHAGGYMQRLQVDQNAAAVSGKCLMIRKSRFLDEGGFDARAELAPWADVDLCLRLQASGYLNVWAPSVALLISDADEPVATAEQEEAMYDRWLPVLARDPGYNTNFSLSAGEDFSIAPANLNWNPLSSWSPIPTVLAEVHHDQHAAQPRCAESLAVLGRAGLIRSVPVDTPLSLVELERLAPDSIVLQAPVNQEQADRMRRLRLLSRAFKVIDLDDCLRPSETNWQCALSHADRLVVSSEALAQAFGSLHERIVMLPNRLDPLAWGGVASHRGAAEKPRVGWSVVGSTVEDLQLIAPMVQALAGDVHWIFIGACPQALRPYVHEYHAVSPGADYPAQLAGLSLDLALLPLLDNRVNACKSNLLLLQYGACGIPVVCSDVLLDSAGLPVTRVKNSEAAWREAVGAYLADPVASAQVGDLLRATVQRDWMLEGESLQRWREAWLPG